MVQVGHRVYAYRWIVLAVFALINAVIQLDWISFAPITIDAITLYQTSAFWIVLLSMSFMLVYLVVSFPASYIIDRFGLRIGVGIGAVLTGVFGYLRGAYGGDYTMVCVSQFALAVAQPFLMNAITKVAAEWFPVNERATANGITVLAQFLGIIVAMVATRPIAESFLEAGAGRELTLSAVQSMLTVYGVVSVASALLLVLFLRDRPPTPPCSEEESRRYSVFAGLKYIFGNRDALLLIGIFFIGLGMFNTITTFIDILLAGKGYIAGGNEAGNVGAVMMVAGILGAIVIPPISDKTRRRRSFMRLCLIAMLPGLAGLTFCTSYSLLLASSAVFGFFFMGVAPLGYQYSAEVSHPAPESTSQGLLVLSGQVSGVIFITVMALLGNITAEALADANRAPKTISLTPFMIGFIVLGLVTIAFSMVLRESPMMAASGTGNKK